MSATVRKLHVDRDDAVARLSSLLWGIEWHKHFPYELPGTGVTVDYRGFEAALPFIKAHFTEIYEGLRTGRFHERFEQKAKTAFYRAAGDFFAFEKDGQTVGMAVCNPLDWSTYYFRNISILPAQQGLGLYPLFFRYLAETLVKYGVQRIEGDIAPANLPHIHAVTKIGMQVSGVNLSDRWGALLHFSLFLDEVTMRAFTESFCDIVRPMK